MSAFMTNARQRALYQQRKGEAYFNTPLVCFHSERLVPHKLFTPLLSGMVATGILLTLILMVLLYKYMQVRKKIQWHYDTVARRPQR